MALGLAVAALLSAYGVGTALIGPQPAVPQAAVPPPVATTPGLIVDDASTPSAAHVPVTANRRAAARSVKPAATRSSGAAPADPKATPARRTAGQATVRRAASRSAASTRDAKRLADSPTAAELAAMQDEVVTLTNVQRRNNGCGELTANADLRTAMRLHVQEVSQHDGLYLSHVSDDGRTFVQRAAAQGYTEAGAENIARGQRTPAEVVQGWMNSEGHRRNIVNCDLQAIGVGVALGDGTLVWGQLFGYR